MTGCRCPAARVLQVYARTQLDPAVGEAFVQAEREQRAA
jgi:hypothetical protein